jgi:uncharacterized membrane protein (UPF0127 family)
MHPRIAALLLAATLTALAAPSAPQATLPTTTLRIGQNSITAEIADDDAEREAGLMFRESLADDHGMLFVMPSIGPVAFWMKNTKIPLSIAYIEPDGTIAELHDLDPFNEKPIRSTFPRIAYALEMPKGWFTKRNIWPGERIAGLPQPARPGQ